MVAPVAEVDGEAGQQPDEEPQPVLSREREHQEQAGGDAEDRHDDAERSPERPVRPRVGVPHDQDRHADHDEGEQRADVGELGQDPQRQERAQHSHDEAGEDGGLPGCPEALVHGAEEALRQQAVTGNGEQHPRLREHHHQQHRGDAGQGAQGDDELRPGQSDLAERVGHRGVDVDLIVRHHPGEDRRHGDVEHGADRKRGDDRDRHVAVRLSGLLGVGRNGVEADVGEEDDGGPCEHPEGLPAGVRLAEDRLAEEADAREPKGSEGVPVRRIDVERADADHEKDHGQLDAHHGGVEADALADSLDQHHGQDQGDDDGREVEDRAGADDLAERRVVVKRRRVQGGWDPRPKMPMKSWK